VPQPTGDGAEKHLTNDNNKHLITDDKTPISD
jgi:hypothetical protein